MNKRKLLHRLITNQKNVKFSDLVLILQSFGFKLDRVSGSHHIFLHSKIDEILNIQNVKDEAKPYQVKQFLKLIELYNLEFKE